eukprot:803949-Pelagomonas_calceolata.AAC.1
MVFQLDEASVFFPSTCISKYRKAFSTVGTPDYISPEVLLKKGYGLECDWCMDRRLEPLTGHSMDFKAPACRKNAATSTLP